MVKYPQMKFAALILLSFLSSSALAAARVVVPSINWLAFGYCIIAAMVLAGVAAICAFGIRVLLRRSTAFLLVFTAASSLITITAQKTNGVNNLPPQQMMPRPMAGVLTPRLDQLQLRGDVGPSVALDDIARGWRVESVTTNESFSYEMPLNAAHVGNWHGEFKV